MLRTLFALAGLALFASPVAATEMYRWVDRDGVLNYSQVKPEGVNAEKVTTRGSITAPASRPAEDNATPGDGTSKPKLTAEQQRKLDELKALHQQEQAQVAAIRQANCEKSRKVLERLQLKEHVRVREDDGRERTLGEDERQRRINDAQVGIATNCT